jgi:hypothetical protein
MRRENTMGTMRTAETGGGIELEDTLEARASAPSSLSERKKERNKERGLYVLSGRSHFTQSKIGHGAFSLVFF